MGDKEDGESDGAIEVFEAGSSSGVELVGAVKAFDDLLELSVFGAFLIFVFQADDGSSFQPWRSALREGWLIDGVSGRVIGGVAVADEFESFVFRKGSDGFGKGDEGIAGSTGIRDVIGLDGAGCGADGEPCIIPSVHNADIRFITGDDGIERAFMVHVEFMAEDSSEICVV